jgi:hypothetical protein
MAASRPATPASAATTRPSSTSPCTARIANATIGVPSFTKLFQMPVTSTESVDREFENPHDPSMA